MVAAIQFRNGRAMSWAVSCGKTCKREDVHNHLVFRDENNHFACNCPCGQIGKYVCKHIRAVWRYEMAAKGYKVSFWKTQDDAKKQRRKTYKVVLSYGMAYATIRRMA